MKRKVALCMITLLTLAIFNLQVTAGTTTISIPDASIEEGQSVNLPIMINDVKNVVGSHILLTYDPSVVQVTDIGNSNLNLETYKRIDNSIGLTRYAVINLDGGLNGNVKFADVMLDSVGNIGESCLLEIDAVSVQDDNYEEIQRVVSSGTFAIITSPENYNYNSRITIDNTKNTESLTDYQVLLELNGNNFDFEKTQSDGDDIRFTNQGGDQLPYWIESFDPANEKARIWVKVDNIPKSGTKIITMYYGNTYAPPASNPKNTFVFFDDFEPASDKWTEIINAWDEGYLLEPNAYVFAQSRNGYYDIEKIESDMGLIGSGTFKVNCEIKSQRSPTDRGRVGYTQLIKYSPSSGEQTLEQFGDLDWTQKEYTISGDDLTLRWMAYGGASSYWWGWAKGWLDDVRIRKYTDPEPLVKIEDETPTKISTYDFGLGFGTDKWAYGYNVNDFGECSKTYPSTEITSSEYAKIAYDDDNYFDSKDPGFLNEAAIRYGIMISEDVSDISKINVLWKGYETEIVDIGLYGIGLYIWNFDSNSYELLDAGSKNFEFALSGSKEKEIDKYIDEDGNFIFLTYYANSDDKFSTDFVKVEVSYTE